MARLPIDETYCDPQEHVLLEALFDIVRDIRNAQQSAERWAHTSPEREKFYADEIARRAHDIDATINLIEELRQAGVPIN